MQSLGGCAAKIPKDVLESVIGGLTTGFQFDEKALVGFGTSDDAAVYQINSEQAIVVTADFFPPMVDDMYLFGQIAVANALSDIYAMGATPLFALNLVCYPENDDAGLRQMLAGGAMKLQEAGVLLLGGHSIHDQGIKYGLVAVGQVSPPQIWRNQGAEIGDVLILTKSLGTGLLTGALCAGVIEPDQLKSVWHQMATLNREAFNHICNYEVHAATDVTGFGLIGHLSEMLPNKGAVLDAFSIPCLKGASQLAAEHYTSKALEQNRRSLTQRITTIDVPDALLDVCFDPQTSGGLLVALNPTEGKQCLAELRNAGIDASLIGSVTMDQTICLR